MIIIKNRYKELSEWQHDRDLVIAEIYPAFANSVMPNPKDLAEPYLKEDDEEREILEYHLSNITWQELATDPAALYHIDLEASFLSIQAIYYYLPAYMIFMLKNLGVLEKHPARSAVDSHELTRFVICANNNLNRLWDLMTANQKPVFCDFLMLTLSHPIYFSYGEHKMDLHEITITEFLEQRIKEIM